MTFVDGALAARVRKTVSPLERIKDAVSNIEVTAQSITGTFFSSKIYETVVVSLQFTLDRDVGPNAYCLCLELASSLADITNDEGLLVKNRPLPDVESADNTFVYRKGVTNVVSTLKVIDDAVTHFADTVRAIEMSWDDDIRFIPEEPSEDETDGESEYEDTDPDSEQLLSQDASDLTGSEALDTADGLTDDGSNFEGSNFGELSDAGTDATFDDTGAEDEDDEEDDFSLSTVVVDLREILEAFQNLDFHEESSAEHVDATYGVRLMKTCQRY